MFYIYIVKQRQAEKKLAEESGRRPGRKRKQPVTTYSQLRYLCACVRACIHCIRLNLNTLTAENGYFRYFRKILPFLLKSRFLLPSLLLYTKWICRFDSALNFEETSSKRHQKVNKFAFFSLNFW